MNEHHRGALPQNIEAERSLLGTIFLKNDCLFDVAEIVAASDFFEPYHAELFNLMRDQIEANRVVTPKTILGDVSQDADIGGVRASKYLADIMEDAPPPVLAVELAKGIKDNAVRRRVIAAASEVIDACYSAPVSVAGEELRDKLDSSVMALFSGVGDLGIRKLDKIGDRVLDDLQAMMKSHLDRAGAGLEVGLVAVQNLTGTFMPGRVYTLAGASGSGKSALAQQISKTVAAPIGEEPLRNVLFEQAEMDGEEMAEREFARMTGISGHRIERGNVDGEEFEKLLAANAGFRKSALYIDAPTAPTVTQIRTKAARMKRLVGLSLIVIDHLSYLAKPHDRMDDVQAIGPNMRGIKQMARSLKVPVLVLAQFKSAFDDGPVRRPGVSDLINPAAVIQNSDVIVFVHRPEYMLRRREPDEGDKTRDEWVRQVEKWKGRAEIILGKNRSGEGFGVGQMFFDAKRTLFSDNASANRAPFLAAGETFDF